MIDALTLLGVMPLAGKRANKFLEPLRAACEERQINTRLRIAAFLATVAVESGELLYVEELASGKAYEGRKDLGNTEPGDGVRFKGRGLIQITGRYNYLDCSKALFGDDRLLQFPELLEDPVNAARSAAWFWWSRGLNQLADKHDFHRITKIVNGGYTHMDRRLNYWYEAKKVLA